MEKKRRKIGLGKTRRQGRKSEGKWKKKEEK